MYLILQPHLKDESMWFDIFLGQYKYQGWDYQGIDVDEEEEDAEADAAAAQDEEEEQEPEGEVIMLYDVRSPFMYLTLLFWLNCWINCWHNNIRNSSL